MGSGLGSHGNQLMTNNDKKWFTCLMRYRLPTTMLMLVVRGSSTYLDIPSAVVILTKLYATFVDVPLI